MPQRTELVDSAPRPTLLRDGEAWYEEPWDELCARVWELSTPHAPFFLLVTLSTTIAAYGLLSNSTAVVIGAMLVAPLMGPIFGIALGLAAGDTHLLGRAAGAELKGMLLSIALALCIGLVPNHPEFGSEILARTRPTVYDIIVAVASGLAGAFALADKRVSPALPGVAIATAIVPPLATVGLCLSVGRFDQAGGAFLLFLANLLAIEATAAAYFTFIGVRRGHLHESSAAGFLRHFGVSVVLLALVGVFLTRTLVAGIEADRRHDVIRRTLGDELRVAQGARLTDLSLELRGDSLRAFAVVMTPQEVQPEQVARMERRLAEVARTPVALVVRSLIARDANRTGPVYAARAEATIDSAAEAQTRVLTRASETLRARLAVRPGVELEELRRERRAVTPAPLAPPAAPADSLDADTTALARAAPAAVDTVDVLTAVVRTPVAVTPAQVDTLSQALERALGAPVVLIVRSVLTRDADARGFLYASDGSEDADSAARAPRAAAPNRRNR
jgi:uncharacterized hydrophobic protein (TIGR00271 family)